MKAFLLASMAAAVLGPSAFAQSLPEEMLALHNSERAQVGVPPLSWSETLASDAQRWANHLAATGQFAHAGSDENPDSGENLAAGGAGSFTAAQLAQLWADEKAYFRYGNFPELSTDGNWATVGHYTQVIWRNTTEIGCALATGSGSDYLVCRYNPPGNYSGQAPY